VIVADYIVNFLQKKGVATIFMITGGQAMFLNDAVFRAPKIKPIFTHHEQAAGMSAEAYSRIGGRLGVCMVTAGPGAINALNGVVGAYVDSAPLMIISGQSSYATVSYMQETKIRQFGLQGINIAPIAKSITKYFKTVDDPAKIQYYLEEAYFQAMSSRKGPVWIEVPLDIQRMEVPVKLLEEFKLPKTVKLGSSLKKETSKTLELLYQSQRPLFLIGQGVRVAGAQNEFSKIIKEAKVPVVTTRLGIDLIENDNPLFVGRPGLYPDRASNLAIQNADLIICVGVRLDTGIVGYDAKDWGRHAKKVVVDLDIEELNKPGINIDLKINKDLRDFLRELVLELDIKRLPKFDKWASICSSWRKYYPMVLPSYKKEKLVNSYYFTQRLSRQTESDDTIVVDTSSPFHVVCQTWEIKKGQRFLTTGGISTMGYWPASIGACLAAKGKRTLVITGDGSLQMNIQELATIKQNKLPIKIFVINNKGYLLIRHTQKTHMEGRLMGESPKTGLWCPDISKVADAYKIHSIIISNTSELDGKIKKALAYPGPVLVDVKSPEWQLVIPRISSTRKPDGSMASRPYEDLYPFLSTQELRSNMIAEYQNKDK